MGPQEKLLQVFPVIKFSPQMQKQVDTVVHKYYKENMSLYTASQWLCQISSKFDKQSAAMNYLFERDPNDQKS